MSISEFITQSIIVSGTLGLAFWKYLGPKLLDEWMVNNFAKKLEKYKHDLNLEKEALKYDLQKQIFQYQTSIEKKSAIYQTLFEKIMIADGAIDQTRKFGFTVLNNLSFEKWGADEFCNALKEYKATSKQIDDVLTDIATNRKLGEDRFIKEREWLKGFDGKIKVRDAKNYFWVQKIYLSPAISQITNDLLTKLVMKLTDNEYPEGTTADQYLKREEVIKQKILDLENQMRLEMSGSDKVS